MSTAPLYELGNELASVLADLESQLVENGGELTPEMEARFNAVNLSWEEKAVRVGLHERRLRADIAECEAERERLAKRVAAMKKTADWIASVYLPRELARAGRSEVRTPLHTLKLVQGRERVEVEIPVSFLPPAWVREKPATYEPDKKAIMQAHNRGEALPEGVRVVRGDPVARVS